MLGARVTNNVRDLAALFVDIDVGTKRDGTPHAYQTHDEAVAALDRAVEKAGLPPPSIIINSGSGGVHAVWALDRALLPDEWLDLARRFKAALERAGLVADWQQTTMQISAPRLPGTFNWKTGDAAAGDHYPPWRDYRRPRFVQALHRHALRDRRVLRAGYYTSTG